MKADKRFRIWADVPREMKRQIDTYAAKTMQKRGAVLMTALEEFFARMDN